MIFLRSYVFLARKGGIGNQLFQLSKVCNFSSITNLSLFISDSSFSTDIYKRDPLDLSDFPVQNNYLCPILQGLVYTIARLFSKFDAFISRNISHGLLGGSIKISHTYDSHWSLKFFTCNIIFVFGYCQDNFLLDVNFISWLEKKLYYYSRVKINQSFSSLNIVDRSCFPNSIALHLRGKEYVTDKNIRSNYGLCGIKYYDLTLAYLQRDISQKVYVFTDDPEFASLHLNTLPNIEIVTIGDPLVEMYLLSLFDFIISSNSTFSFWASIIASHVRNSKVFVPSPWFLNSTLPHPSVRYFISMKAYHE